jgi:beta-lactamase regulating signal transducer with metallopeptidase domain
MSTQFPLVSMSWHLAAVMAIVLAVKLLGRFDWFRRRPSLMHSLWVLVMLKLITPAIIALPIYELTAKSNWFQSSRFETSSDRSMDSPPLKSIDARTETVVATERSSTSKSEVKTPHELGSTPQVSLSDKIYQLSSLGSAVYMVWFIVSLAFLIHLALQVAGVNRLRRLLKTNSWLQKTATSIGHRIGCSRIPEVRVIDVAMSPSLTGCFRPVILIPKRLTLEFSQEQLEAVLAHELAHYRRWDHLTAMAGLAIRSLCWWNPIAWWAYYELRHSQEICCDAIAVEKAQVPKGTYARSLWSVVKWLDQETAVRVGPSAAMVSDSPNRHFRDRLLALARSQNKLELGVRDWLIVLMIGLALVCHPSYGAVRFSPHAFRYQSSELIAPRFHTISTSPTAATSGIFAVKPYLDYQTIAHSEFWFGRGDKPILLALFESQSKKEKVLWVDSNQDHEIQIAEFAEPTQDPFIWSVRLTGQPKSTETAKELNLPAKYEALHASTECKLLVRFEDNQFSIAQSGQLHGTLSFNGRDTTAAVEDRNCNGRWTDRDDRLYIDLNGDGKWSAPDERFSCQELPFIQGQRYTLAFQNDELDLIPLDGTGKLQAEVHLLSSDATIESCRAVLASTAGVHITLDSLEHSIEIPVGEYVVKQVRLRLHDERVWALVFESIGKDATRVKVTKDSQSKIDLLGELKLDANIIAGSLQSYHEAPLMVQPMCTTETGLYLARCAVGSSEADEDSLLTGTISMANGSSHRIGGIETTGFACGTFCPIRFPKSENNAGVASVYLQFDSGPLAGLLTATLDGKPE